MSANGARYLFHHNEILSFGFVENVGIRKIANKMG